MSASISLSDVSWSTPDGRELFSNVSLTFERGLTGLVGRNGVGKSTLLGLMAGRIAPRTGSVQVRGSIGCLFQDVGIGDGATVATLFGVGEALALLDRAERGLAGAEELAAADWGLEARVTAALAGVGLEVLHDVALSKLSGGQRTRAALAALAFAEPDFALLDEPTNNLDQDGREAVARFLAGWRGGAVVVSHDRDLLERMDGIVELTTLGARRYGGGWSAYRAQREVDLEAARHDLYDAERRVAEVARTAQAVAERKARRDAGGRRVRARGDQPKILLDARKERAEGTRAGNARVAEARHAQAAEDAAAARARVEVLQPMTVALAATGLHDRRLVLEVSRVRAGYGDGPEVLRGFDLEMVGPERVALTGANGAGKSTALAVIGGSLVPRAGSVRVCVPFAVMDQRMAMLEAEASVVENFRRLNRSVDENGCRAALARFLFRGEAALQRVGDLSGGQMLRAGLACVIGGDAPPPLLILDEPTNHLDVETVEIVEAGLRAYDGALLVVSHDAAFLEAVGITRRVPVG